MKVEVSIIKRPGIKVSVTLARSRRKGCCVNIPVRTAPKDEAAAESAVEGTAEAGSIRIGFADSSDCSAANLSDAGSSVPAEESECPEDFSSDDDTPEELTEDAPDEEDLLALIEEEEAEMALHMQHEASPEFDDEQCSCENESDEWAVEPDDEAYDEASADPHAPVAQYMRYFDRSTDGGKFEVDDSLASGQEIICVDGESGRLSRVCGFIRNNHSAQQSEDGNPDGSEPSGQE